MRTFRIKLWCRNAAQVTPHICVPAAPVCAMMTQCITGKNGFRQKKHSTPNFAQISEKLVSTPGTVFDPTHLRACGASMRPKKTFSTKKNFLPQIWRKIRKNESQSQIPVLRRQYAAYFLKKKLFRPEKTFYLKFRIKSEKNSLVRKYRSCGGTQSFK